MTKRLVIVLLALGVLFGAIFGFKAFMNAQISNYFENMQPPPVAVSTAPAEETVWEPTIPAVGTLKAVNGVMVAAELPGVVESIAFESGQSVTRGDLLVQLDTSTDRAQLAALEAQLRLARSEFNRQNELRRRGTNAVADLDAAEANAAQLEAQIASQQATINKKAIKAPFDGVTGIRKVDIGQYVGAGTSIVSLQQMDPLLVQFTLPERRLNDVEVGQLVRLHVDSVPDSAFTGHVTAIEPSVEQSTRNFAVEGRVDNASRRLRPGLFARIDVVMPQIERLTTLPATAIAYNPYGDSVYIIAEGEAGEDGNKPTIAKRVFVEVGDRRGDQVAVLKGVEAGAEVVTSGQLKLSNGSRVNIQNTIQPDNNRKPSPVNK